MTLIVRDDIPASFKRCSQVYGQDSRQMVIAGASVAYARTLADRLVFSETQNASESLDRMGNLRRADSVVAMAPLAAQLNETTLQ